MKIRIISIGVIFVTAISIMYGFINHKSNTCKKNDTAIINKKRVAGYAFNEAIKPADELNYTIKRTGNKFITKDKVIKAKQLPDLIEYYPHNWIETYDLVTVGVIKNGVETKLTSKNYVLTPEQISLINTVNLNDVIVIHIKYKSKNPVTEKKEDNELNYDLKVSPEHQAEFKGGYYKMIQHLKGNTGISVLNWAIEKDKQAILHFWVDEEGKVVNVVIKKTSGVEVVDNELERLIKDMPQWNPAKSNHENVMQEFEFAIGNSMC